MTSGIPNEDTEFVSPADLHKLPVAWVHPSDPYHYYHPYQVASAVYGGAPGHHGAFGYYEAPPKNYKTVVCRHFLRGHCALGSRCHFRHQEDGPMVSQPPSRDCRRWAQNGQCYLGDKCAFKHEQVFGNHTYTPQNP
jgi:hypothetical protein